MYGEGICPAMPEMLLAFIYFSIFSIAGNGSGPIDSDSSEIAIDTLFVAVFYACFSVATSANLQPL